jgi:hypothetical protein
VGDYVCLTVQEATDQIESDGFEVGTIFGGAVEDDWFINDQSPEAGEERAVGTSVDMQAVELLPAECV